MMVTNLAHFLAKKQSPAAFVVVASQVKSGSSLIWFTTSVKCCQPYSNMVSQSGCQVHCVYRLWTSEELYFAALAKTTQSIHNLVGGGGRGGGRGTFLENSSFVQIVKIVRENRDVAPLDART